MRYGRLRPTRCVANGNGDREIEFSNGRGRTGEERVIITSIHAGKGGEGQWGQQQMVVAGEEPMMIM